MVPGGTPVGTIVKVNLEEGYGLGWRLAVVVNPDFIGGTAPRDEQTPLAVFLDEDIGQGFIHRTNYTHNRGWLLANCEPNAMIVDNPSDEAIAAGMRIVLLNEVPGLEGSN